MLNENQKRPPCSKKICLQIKLVIAGNEQLVRVATMKFGTFACVVAIWLQTYNSSQFKKKISLKTLLLFYLWHLQTISKLFTQLLDDNPRNFNFMNGDSFVAPFVINHVGVIFVCECRICFFLVCFGSTGNRLSYMIHSSVSNVVLALNILHLFFRDLTEMELKGFRM